LLEVAFWAGGLLALYHGHPLLASLLLCFWVIRCDGIPVPGEVAYWVLGGALLEAYAKGEMAVFALESPLAIVRVCALLVYLPARLSSTWWEGYFLGSVMYPGWSAAAFRWRGRGRVAHVLAWTAALAIALAWTAGLWWWAFTWGSLWRLPYLVVLSAIGLWWCLVAVYCLNRRLLTPSAEADEATLAPPDWARQAAQMLTEPTAWSAAGLPPAALDLATGFGGAGDRRLRRFAADCAEHALPAEGRGVSRIRRDVVLVIKSARRRADDDLHGSELTMAFRHAAATSTRTTGRITGKHGDLELPRRLDDAAGAAYHALCAPTPLDAATHAANCSAVTFDGALREDEHAWQLRRLEHYRAQREDPA